MTIYKLRKKLLKEKKPKEGDEKTERNYTYKFINEGWRIIHFKDSDRYEYWNDYDEKGNVVHFKNSNGYEYWYDYDEKGNVVHYKNSVGYEYWKDYDEKGNMIHYKHSDGYEYWKDEKHDRISKEEFDKIWEEKK